MKKAWIENGIIRDVAPVGKDPFFIYGTEIGANYNTDVPDDAAHGWILENGQWVAPPPPPPQPDPVPQSVTRRQAKQALALAGFLDQVQPAIDAIEDPLQRNLMQIEWDDSQEFLRDRPQLIQLATALGMDSDQIDELFILAATL